jgi:argininosuccinate lyase
METLNKKQRASAIEERPYKLLAQPTAAAYVNGFAAPGIEGSRFFFDALLRYHLASLAVLVDQGIVPRARGRKLAAAYFEVRKKGFDGLTIDPGLEDLQPNVEKAVIALVGAEDGGDFGIARARAEFGHVAAHLALREETLATIQEQIELAAQMLSVASRHTETIVPYYTQHMRAEPITFGYYFSAFAEAFVQNVRRMRDCFQRYSRSPAGIGHIVPTPLPLDRMAIAKSIGLDEVVHHSLYGYLNSDVFVDTLGTASISAATVSRMCLDFWWWASNELEVFRYGDAWCGGSFIMPHKRNPSWQKALRFAAMAVKARHDEAQELWMHGAPMFLVGSLPIPALTHEGLKSLRYCCELMGGALADLTIDADRARRVAENDFVQSSQLVSMIVARQQASWRQAELVVGRFVKEAADQGRAPSSLSFDRLVEVGREVLGRDLVLDREEFGRALALEAIVRSRGDCGPAPDAVTKAIAAQGEELQALRAWADSQAEAIAQNWSNVDKRASQL